ncbi:MAG: hypothetical protein AAFZ52_19035, partial [Bacteroidota bacterium]
TGPPPEATSAKRARNLALVRTGDAAKTANLLKNVRRYPVNDEFIYTVVPLLTYTRNRKVIDYLWQQALTENTACTPADAETSGRIDCAYRIVEFLAPIIPDFPVKHDDSGILLVADYSAALAEIRRWYAAHTTDYLIDRTTF